MKSFALACCAAISLHAYAAGPLLLMLGPPGSGRTTQAELLRKDLGFRLISADDLISRNPQKFEKNKAPSLQGVEIHLDPALNQLVADALSSTDLSKGVVLDGYPASKTQGDFLTTLRQKLGLPSAIIIHLSAPDDVVRKRLKNQTGRDIDQELKDYHREFDFVRDYFPEADIRTVDATRSRAQVAKEIRKLLQSHKN